MYQAQIDIEQNNLWWSSYGRDQYICTANTNYGWYGESAVLPNSGGDLVISTHSGYSQLAWYWGLYTRLKEEIPRTQWNQISEAAHENE